MAKQPTFGDATLARKMSSKFSVSKRTIQAKMRHVEQVKLFLSEAERAHQQTAKSKLQFG